MSTEKIFVRFDNQTPKQQAIQILNRVNQLSREGLSKVGITYSANQEQTSNIIKTYKEGRWLTGTSGSNQAAVITSIEKLLENEPYTHLQKVFRIVPITTMDYKTCGLKAADTDVTASLDAAKQFIDGGGHLLGWTNQASNGAIAIGGGVAVDVQPEDQKKQIRAWEEDAFSKHGSPIKLNQKQQLQAAGWSPIRNQYAYRTQGLIGRSHFFTVSASNFPTIDSKFSSLTGDYLKSMILNDFMEQIKKTDTQAELERLKGKLLNSTEFDVLKTGQGLFTRITRIKTSSVEALEQMFHDQEAMLPAIGEHKKGKHLDS